MIARILRQWLFVDPVGEKAIHRSRISLIGLMTAFSLFSVYVLTPIEIAQHGGSWSGVLLGLVPVVGQCVWTAVLWASGDSSWIFAALSIALVCLFAAIRLVQVRRLVSGIDGTTASDG